MSKPKAIVHPLAGALSSVYWKRRRTFQPYSSASRFSRVATSLAHLAQAGLAWGEHCVWGRRIARWEIEKPPVFIIGHWRSGTTYLHNLLSQDDRFGYLSLGQMAMPGKMLGVSTKILHAIVNRSLPKKRSFDGIKLGINKPQEEEIALANLNLLSYYNCYYYPQYFIDHFQKSVLFEGATEKEIRHFTDSYQLLLKKLSFVHGGKQLLLKNPASTARVRLLKQTFPNAKFIHIVRNPYHLFPSSLKRLSPMLRAFAWQEWSDLDQEEVVFHCYEKLMHRVLEDRKTVPDTDWFELSYEQLTAKPIETLQSIYRYLDQSWEPAQPQISTYMESLQGYQKNKHTMKSAVADQIATRWKFALSHWQYELPDDVVIENS